MRYLGTTRLLSAFRLHAQEVVRQLGEALRTIRRRVRLVLCEPISSGFDPSLDIAIFFFICGDDRRQRSIERGSMKRGLFFTAGIFI